MSATDAEHQRQPDVYVRPRYPVDDPPTYRARCVCGWSGAERYRGLTDADWDRHVAPAATATDADRAKADVLAAYRDELRPAAIAAALTEARATERAAADQLRADVEKLAEEMERAGADARSAATLLPITDPNRRELAVRALYRATTAARLRAILDAR
jgi:hypothetical protein